MTMISWLLYSSKTSILQLRMRDVATEWHITVWMFPCCKWSWIWFMVNAIFKVYGILFIFKSYI